MSSRSRIQEVIPSASRLMDSLRDIGYDFNTAIADILDNSITAKATEAHIEIKFEGDNSWVCIADNGIGMDAATLTNAMRYGSEREYTEEDLGKFGLGLKTASMSQCQRLTVASRNNAIRNNTVVRQWDLAHIKKTDKWELLTLTQKESLPQLTTPLKSNTGTVVFWERIDRIIEYQQPWGTFAKNRLLAMCRELEAHLGMVFHRFLEGEVKNQNFNIFVNGNPVAPWNPFARSEKNTRRLRPHKIEYNQDGIKGTIGIQPYVLPHKARFSNLDAFNSASGPEKWNKQQGFYIYRSDRLIQSGGWSGLRTIDEHTKLARIALNMTPALDSAFKINVAKMRVQLPTSIKKELEVQLVDTIKAAQNEYRKEGKKTKPPLAPEITGINTSTPVNKQPPSKIIGGYLTNGHSKNANGETIINPSNKDQAFPSSGKSDPGIGETRGEYGNKYSWSLEELYQKLLSIADPDEAQILQKLFNKLQNQPEKVIS